MRGFSLSSDGKLAITASETSSKSDFDYLIGNWNIRNRTLKEPLAGSDEWDEFDEPPPGFSRSRRSRRQSFRLDGLLTFFR
jgi:hypothetical protein